MGRTAVAQGTAGTVARREEVGGSRVRLQGELSKPGTGLAWRVTTTASAIPAKQQWDVSLLWIAHLGLG